MLLVAAVEALGALWSGILLALGAAFVAAIVALVRWSLRKWQEELAQQTVALSHKIDGVHAELKPNGGSSAVDMMTSALGQLREEMGEEFKTLRAERDAGFAALGERLDALEARQNGDDARARGELLPPPPPPIVGVVTVSPPVTRTF